MTLKICNFIPLVILTSYAFAQQAFDVQSSIDRGKALYQVNCGNCHMIQGEGVPGVFPPLAKSEHLQDDQKLVTVLSKGMKGPMTVNGKNYNGEMSPSGLNAKQMADVINYIRSSWDNKRKVITPTEVQKALQ